MSLDWAVGQIITDERLNRRLPIRRSKPGNTAAAGDASVNADPDLVFTLKANTTYDLRGVLLVTSAADNTGDFRRAWIWTGGTATVTMGGAGGVNTILTGSSGDGEWVAKDPDSTSPTAEITYVASTTVTGSLVDDEVVVGTADITLTLTWAQATASGTTTLRAGSRVVAYPTDGT